MAGVLLTLAMVALVGCRSQKSNETQIMELFNAYDYHTIDMSPAINNFQLEFIEGKLTVLDSTQSRVNSTSCDFHQSRFTYVVSCRNEAFLIKQNRHSLLFTFPDSILLGGRIYFKNSWAQPDGHHQNSSVLALGS
jgi:hypothetical protein